MDAELSSKCEGVRRGVSAMADALGCEGPGDGAFATMCASGDEKADGGAPATVRILVVEDDSAINDVVCRRLAREGYSVESAFSGTEAGRLLAAERFDLVITDLMLPGMTGEEVVALVRQLDAALPVMVISARTAAADKVGLLGLGADDYLTKPFDLDEMAARVKVQLRHRTAREAAGSGVAAGGRTAGADVIGGTARNASDLADPGTICEGAVVVSPLQRSALCGGVSLPLTRIEFDILELLASHPKRVFTKQELYELVWGEPFLGQENSVSVHVSNLRAKMKAAGADGYIQTVWGLGFKFEVPAQL